MPIVRNITGGAEIIASAKIARRFIVTVNPGESSTEAAAQLQVNTLPHGVWYALQTTIGIGGVTITPQFAVDNRGLAGSTEPRWFPVLIPQVLVANVPFFATQRLVANMISSIITVPGGAAGPVTVELILAASI